MQTGLGAAAVLTLAGLADPWDQCVDNPALPYDRPLGIKMQALDAPDFDLLALFISAGGYLYCDVRDSMSRRELAYRVERFVKASDAAASAATPTPLHTPRGRLL